MNSKSERISLSDSQGRQTVPPAKRIGRRRFLKLSGALAACAATRAAGIPSFGPLLQRLNPEAAFCAPGWQGAVLIDGESLTNWAVEHDAGSSGSLSLAPGFIGQAVQLDWRHGSGSWVQARYAFPASVDLSQADIFGITLRGGGAGEVANTVSIMFADVNDVFYGYEMPVQDTGINQVDRWLINLAIPRRTLWPFWGNGTQIDWSKIARFFVVVDRPTSGTGGGAGRLAIDHVQVDTAANWPRQTKYATVTADDQAAANATSYLLSQQDPSTGLFVSWKEEESAQRAAKSWLYDQALVLIALTREGRWSAGSPTNQAAKAAAKLAGFITGKQKGDGHWSRGWNSRTGQELLDDGWVGDQGWWVMALAYHARKAWSSAAMDSAQLGAAWVAARIDPMGKVAGSTEGTVDAWWAMISTGRLSDADKIKNYLLGADTVWDPQLRYWWRGFKDPVIAMDAAAWLSAFARHPLVRQPERGLAALSFVRRTLATQSQDGRLCGFDGMGPVSIWNEGVAQYVAAGGEDAQTYVDMLVAQQHPDGSMPGSTESWPANAFGWLTTWSGLAPTAWLYFALTGAPFPSGGPIFLPITSKSYRRSTQ